MCLKSRTMSSAVGVRVVRGPEWAQSEADGGEGHVGTVTEVKDGGQVKVVWDGGQVTECQASGASRELRVLCWLILTRKANSLFL